MDDNKNCGCKEGTLPDCAPLAMGICSDAAVGKACIQHCRGSEQGNTVSRP